MENNKSKNLAGILAIFLPPISSFYLGYIKRGIVQLILNLLILTGVGVIACIAAYIWSWYLALQIFSDKMPDANGNPLV